MHPTTGGFFFALLLLLAVFWMAKRNGFFQLPKVSHSPPISFLQTFGIFLTYLIFALLVVPISTLFFVYLKTGYLSSIKHLPIITLGWIQVIALSVLFMLLLFYCCLINRKTRQYIFWGEGDRTFARALKAIGMGVLTFVISYPFVLITSILTKFISNKLWGEIQVEQSAVKQLKMMMGHNVLFGAMVIFVVFLIPFLEELLFRGFLQNLLTRYLGRTWSIILSGCIFAFAHFSKSQAEGNFQLIGSLFVLSLFLGFIYERQRTLWASFGLHMTFNAFNVLMIIL